MKPHSVALRRASMTSRRRSKSLTANKLVVLGPGWRTNCQRHGPKGADVQRTIEVLIGRLITDEEFRKAFVNHPYGTLAAADDWGLHLSHHEIAALVATERTL